MSKIVAIHQPNFFPWLGFFDKICCSDVFVLMDNVQFPKKGGTWTNRVRVKIADKAAWITMPVKRDYHGVRAINQMEINDSSPWRRKLLTTIEVNYSKAPFFSEGMSFLEPLLNFQTLSVSDFNIHAIRAFASMAGWEKKLVLGSSLNAHGSATELLIEMTKAVGGSAYLCGGGADGYQIDGMFKDSGLDLIYQNFVHPTYSQYGTTEFIPGLSIVDVLVNLGLDGCKSLLYQKADASA